MSSQPNEQYLAKRFAKERLKSRLGGLLLLFISSGMIWAVFSHKLHVIGSSFVAMPLFFMIGICLLIKPINRAESFYLYQTPNIPWKKLPILIKVLIILGVVFSVILAIKLF